MKEWEMGSILDSTSLQLPERNKLCYVVHFNMCMSLRCVMSVSLCFARKLWMHMLLFLRVSCL